MLILALSAVSFGQSSESSAPALGRLNGARQSSGAERVESSAALDGLAARYLDDLLTRRSLIPAGYGAVGQRTLSDEVAGAIGADGYNYRYVGVAVAYGQSLNHAMDIALGTVANGPALFEPALTMVGLASAAIPAGAPWFAPPPGGFGREIEMTGMTLVVIVTAGPYRASP